MTSPSTYKGLSFTFLIIGILLYFRSIYSIYKTKEDEESSKVGLYISIAILLFAYALAFTYKKNDKNVGTSQYMNASAAVLATALTFITRKDGLAGPICSSLIVVLLTIQLLMDK